MFTLQQISQAHSKVKSGEDFPAYIREIKQLGVTGYEAYVHNGEIVYFGEAGFHLTAPEKYPEKEIAAKSDIAQFMSDLKSYQQGQTDYPTFCSDCAKSGVEKWVIDLQDMTCTYYDLDKNMLHQEKIPS